MRKIKLNFLLIFNFFIFSNITFSEENIYRIDYIIFKFLPDITSEERFLPPEIFFSDELINITNLGQKVVELALGRQNNQKN